jgi:hypothetical protein
VAKKLHGFEDGIDFGFTRRQRHGVDQRGIDGNLRRARREFRLTEHGQRQRLGVLGQQQRKRATHLLVGLEGAGVGLDHGNHRERSAGQLHRHRRLDQRVDFEATSLHRGLDLNAARHFGQGLCHRQQ